MPDWKQEITNRLRPLKLAPAHEAAIVEELAQHLEDRYQELVAGGATDEDARCLAREELSDDDLLARGLRRVQHEVFREPVVQGGSGGNNFVARVWQDVRYGVRMLCKNARFTALAVMTLALGIGANTAIFSVVNAVLLRPLPYPDPGQLVVVGERWMGGGGDLAPPDYLDIAAENHVFEQMAAYRSSNFNLSAGDRPERVSGAVVTINIFNLLGVKPILGRSFLPGDGDRGGNRTMILGYALWQARFGGRLDVIGEKVILNDETYIVVGVMPPSFDFPESAQVWVPPRFAVPEHPLRPDVDPATMPGAHYFDSIARLRRGVGVAQARADVDGVIRHILERRPDTEARDGAWIETLHESQVGDLRPALLVLLGAVGLVLLIACANVANLLLASGAGRRKEMAIRSAIGAGRTDLLRQLLTESVLLAALGGALAILFASWGTRPLGTLIPQDLRSAIQLSVDVPVLLFTALASLLAALFFGLTPALQGSRIALTQSLKEGGQSMAPGRQAAQRILVVAESALAVVLLIGAGLLVKSFLRLVRVNVGFDPTHVITLNLSLPHARYSDPAKRCLFVRQALNGISALPGVRLASVVTRLPFGGGDSYRGIEIEGRPSRPDDYLSILYSVATPGYFRTLGIPLLRGRDFTERDDSTAPGVVIINHVMANAFWPGDDPVGKRIKIGADKLWEVVGVAGDTRQHDLGESVAPMFYAPYAQDAWPSLTVAVRVTGDPRSLATEAERAISIVDKEEAVYGVRTMSEVVETSLLPRRCYMLLLGLFAMLALALAAVGLFGVISFGVEQRTHEIGIRMALGAGRADVLKLVVGLGLKLTLMGLGVGIMAALAMTRFLAMLLYGVKPTDPVTYIAVSLILTAVALMASYIPARRATKLDPMVALRYQ